MTGKPVVKVSCTRMVEDGKGPSWWVTLTNAAGQTITPNYYYDRDHALCDVDEWASFFGIEPTPYVEDGVVVEPSMKLAKYDEDED